MELVAIFAELTYRRYGYEEICRKCVHIISGVVACLMLKSLEIASLLLFLGMSIVVVIIIRNWGLMKLLNNKVRGHGELYSLVGSIGVIFTSQYSMDIAIATILISTFSDGLAPFGKHLIKKPWIGTKSIGSSLIFFIITVIICSFFFGFKAELILLSFILMLIEGASSRGLDNATVPAGSIILLFSLLIYR